MEGYEMGILTGTELLFYVLGITTTLLVFGLIKLNNKYHFKWYVWGLSVTCVFLMVFTIAWSVSSILEGESQAANMGLLMFGLPALIFSGITRKLLNKNVIQN